MKIHKGEWSGLNGRSLHSGEVAKWTLEGHTAEVKDGEKNKPAFSLPQCSHRKIDFQLVPPRISRLGIVDVGMQGLNSRKWN